MSEFDNASPALMAALTKADSIASGLIACQGGVEVQSNHLPQRQVAFTASYPDVHPPDEEDLLTRSLTATSAPARTLFEFSREDDKVEHFMYIMDQPALAVWHSGTAAGTDAAGNAVEAVAAATSTIYRPRWNATSACLREVALHVGGVCSERLRTEIMQILQQHYRRVGFNPELGDGFNGDDESERAAMQAQAKYQQRRFLRLPLGIARAGFPLAAIGKHKLEVEIIARKLNDCVAIDQYDASGNFVATIGVSDLPSDNKLCVRVGRSCLKFGGASDSDGLADLDVSQLTMMPALMTNTLCKLESDSLLAASQTGAIVASDGSSIQGSGPYEFKYVAPAEQPPFVKELPQTDAASDDVLIADSDLWTSVPIISLVVTAELKDTTIDSADFLDDSFEMIHSARLLSNNKEVQRWHTALQKTDIGTRSAQVMPSVIGGKRVYMLSFESVSEADKGAYDHVSGLFAVSSSTHPRIVIQRMPGAPKCEFTVHKVISNSFVLQDGSFVLTTSYSS